MSSVARSARLFPRRALGLLLGAAPFAGCTAGSATDDDGGVQGDGGLSADLRFELEPAEPILASIDGSTPSVALRVMAESLAGERFEVRPLRWELEHDRIGMVDQQ